MCRVTLDPVPNANRNASHSVLYANARDRSSACAKRGIAKREERLRRLRNARCNNTDSKHRLLHR